MYNLTKLEEYYKKYSEDLNQWLPEDIFEVDLPLLQKMDLINYDNPESQDPNLTQFFHVIETFDKITLINDEFVVWIVPDIQEDHSRTYTMVARNESEHPHLELAYITSGSFNNSKLILRVLEKLLYDIHENQNFLDRLE